MKNYKNTEEQISRIKQLITEETLYGKLVDNNIISEVAGGTKGVVNTFLKNFYQIPVTKFDDVTNALSDITDDTLKELDSFKRINKVIDGNELGGKSGSFTSTDFKTYIGGEFITDLNKFFDDVNDILDTKIYSGMRSSSPDTTGAAYQTNWTAKKNEVIKYLGELKLSDGSVSVDEVKRTFLGNFDNFIKNYGKIANNYTNLNVFKKILIHIFGNHKGDLKSLIAKIQTFYKDKVFNVKDWGNYKEYIGRYKEGWGNIKSAKGLDKLREFARLSKGILPVGYYSKYVHVLIIKTLIMEIYCNAREDYDPFQKEEIEEGVIHNKKIIKEDEEGYTALDPAKNAILFAWDNIYPILNLISVFFGVPLTAIMLDPMKLLGAGLTDMSCENFYVKNLKDFEAEIISLIDSGKDLKVKTDDGKVINLSGSELKSELDKAVTKFKSAGEDPLQLLNDLFTFGNDISGFTLVGDNGEDIPLLNGKRINKKWIKKVEELREEYGGGKQ